jgi:hypothetical protein
MKNVHLISTDKPSRICEISYYGAINDGKVKFLVAPNDNAYIYEKGEGVIIQPKNIYITNDEEIKEGDYVYSIKQGYNIQKVPKGLVKSYQEVEHYKKIILTTDHDLINDGIQPIDDEFLEWFVKNTSCELIEVEDTCLEIKVCNCSINDYCLKPGYTIIIPQEEPKPHSFCKTPEEKCTMNYCDENGCQNRVRHLVEPKQETLEGAAEKWYDSTEENKSFSKIKAFKEGAKYQAERMYSEEDLRNAYRWGTTVNHGTKEHFKEWFKQFKKK